MKFKRFVLSPYVVKYVATVAETITGKWDFILRTVFYKAFTKLSISLAERTREPDFHIASGAEA